MGSIVRQSGKYKAVVRRKGHRHIYEIFNKLSDARSFINKVESDIQQKEFKDISEANNTSLRVVLHRYIREKLQHKQDKKRERSKFNAILRHDIVKIMLGELRTSDFAKYRDSFLLRLVSFIQEFYNCIQFLMYDLNVFVRNKINK